MDVIKRISGERKSKLYIIGKDIFFETITSNLEGQVFRLLTRYNEFSHLKIQLLGDFQIENAAAAVAAVEALRSGGIFIENRAIKDGLAKARWSGRLELIGKKPFIVADGAQDVNSVSRLKKAVGDIFKYKRLFLVFGAMQDKDIDGLCRELGGAAHWIVATRSKSERACPPKIIKKSMSKYNKGIDIINTDSVAEAVKSCRQKAGEEDLVLITGSLYVVAEAMQALRI